MEVEVVECDRINQLLGAMHRILFNPKMLSPHDKRDLENLLALVQDEIRTNSVKVKSSIKIEI
jgi:hypothetical protein